MGKRRHQSSSVEEVSPAIIKRKSSRLTRSKKVKAEAASPILSRSPVSRRHHEAGPSRRSPVFTKHHEAGPSRTRSTHQGRLSRRRSNMQSLLAVDCTTPVRFKPGRNSLLISTPSPYSQSEPEITWDDKSPNAIQPRKLGKGAKRNAIEDISDIINCVPDIVTDDNSNTKPSLLSLWMNRDSPSPKATHQTNQDTNKPQKKKGGGKNNRKSRLSALTHELEKVLSVIEPGEEQTEATIVAEEQPHCSSTDSSAAIGVVKVETKTMTLSNTQTMPKLLPHTPPKPPNSTTMVDSHHTSPTLYTQAKPTQMNQCDKNITLPALGQSPVSDGKKQSDSPSSDGRLGSKHTDHPTISPPLLKLEQLGSQLDRANGSDESPPGSQSKWEAIGNASAEELWGDDDFFEDDDLLMGTIQVEIASSQMPTSTPVRKVKKRLSLNRSKKVSPAVSANAAASNGKDQGHVTQTNSATVLKINDQQNNTSSTNHPKLPKAFVPATSKVETPTNIVHSGPNKTFSSSYPTQTKSVKCNNDKSSLSQKVFIPHPSNPSSQPHKDNTIGVNQQQNVCVHSSQMAQRKAPTSATYALKSSDTIPTSTLPTSISKAPQITTSGVNQTSSRVVSNNANRTMQQSAGSTQFNKQNVTISQSSSSSTSQYASVARTSPPNVTRVVYSATSTSSAITNRPANSSSSQINKFVPFKSAVSVSKPISSRATTTTSSAAYQKTSEQLKAKDCKLVSSKSYVPFQKVTTSKEQDVVKKVPPVSSSTSQMGRNDVKASQQEKVYVPFSKQSVQPTTQSSGHYSQTCSKPNATLSSQQYVPYKKLTNQALPTSRIQTQGTNQALPASIIQTQCTKPFVSRSNNPSTNVSKCNTSLHSATQSVPPSAGNPLSLNNPASATSSSKSEFNQQKCTLPAATNISSSKSVCSGASKAFVPFKKPSNLNTEHQSSTVDNTTAYKPSITRPRSTFKFQPSNSKQHQTSSQMSGQTTVTRPKTKPSAFVRHNSSSNMAASCNISTAGNSVQAVKPVVSAPSAKSNTFVKQNIPNTGMSNCNTSVDYKSARSSQIRTNNVNLQHHSIITTSQQAVVSRGTRSQTNVSQSLTNSKYSNNNISTHPPPHKTSNPPASAGCVLSSTATAAVTAGLVSASAELDQFDDELLMMSLAADMDGSWDEF